MSNEALRGRVRQIIDAFNRQDFAAAASGMHDDVVVEYPQSGERITGVSNLQATVEGMEGPSPTFTLWRLGGEGNVVTAESVADEPDGKRYFAFSIYEFDGDRVAHEVDYFTEPFPAAEARASLVTLHDMPAEALRAPSET